MKPSLVDKAELDAFLTPVLHLFWAELNRIWPAANDLVPHFRARDVQVKSFSYSVQIAPWDVARMELSEAFWRVRQAACAFTNLPLDEARARQITREPWCCVGDWKPKVRVVFREMFDRVPCVELRFTIRDAGLGVRLPLEVHHW